VVHGRQLDDLGPGAADDGDDGFAHKFLRWLQEPVKRYGDTGQVAGRVRELTFGHIPALGSQPARALAFAICEGLGNEEVGHRCFRVCVSNWLPI
jgi:hypothetical protein